MWKHCTFITLFYRAQIERENKDIRLEKIRVKAAEQRETVLQSIKLVVLSIPFTCFLYLPRFFPILILHSSIEFFPPISMFLFKHYYFSSPCLLSLDLEASSSSLQQLSSWLVNSVISAPFLQPRPSVNEYICTPLTKPAPPPPPASYLCRFQPSHRYSPLWLV